MNPDFPMLPAPEARINAFSAKAAATEADALRQSLADQRDLNQRLAAEFESFKRCSRQEGEARAAAEKESCIHELLPVMDNLERTHWEKLRRSRAAD